MALPEGRRVLPVAPYKPVLPPEERVKKSDFPYLKVYHPWINTFGFKEFFHPGGGIFKTPYDFTDRKEAKKAISDFVKHCPGVWAPTGIIVVKKPDPKAVKEEGYL